MLLIANIKFQHTILTACKVALENSIALLPIKLRESKSTSDLKENKNRITYQQEKPVSHTHPTDFRQADLGNSSIKF